MLDRRMWIFLSEILELIKNKSFYDEDVVGILFTYLKEENKVIYNCNREGDK